jgi:hypothetical protein
VLGGGVIHLSKGDNVAGDENFRVIDDGFGYKRGTRVGPSVGIEERSAILEGSAARGEAVHALLGAAAVDPDSEAGSDFKE